MGSMNGLLYKTLGNVLPYGHQRVYLCCHRDDFSACFDQISEEILRSSPKVAIWYRDPAEDPVYDEQFLSQLGQMQLFVVPVTRRFIEEENLARTVELRYALENHIPVLPLMQESGLEEQFNQVCGNLQCLDRGSINDNVTAVPFEIRLKNYLGSVLIDEELTRRIRSAFDFYIFLSYRKKDRKYAQKIMRLIHENEICRDIAIWYDEFLTPGEDFNNEISDAIEKSRLFAMVVTPNLLEVPNYVSSEEYPAAVSSGKPILPVEGEKTDTEELRALYSDIPDLVSAEEAAGHLQDYLQDIALRASADDPGHNYLIGLAYLNGIDVEINRDRALELITSAAEADLPEAYEKLVAMYNTGDSVRRDQYTAIEWQTKYLDYLQNKAEPGKEISEKTAEALYRLGEMQYGIRDLQKARETFETLLMYARNQIEPDGPEMVNDSLLISTDYLARINVDEGRLSEAREQYQYLAAVSETLANTYKRFDFWLSLSVCYSQLAVISAKQDIIPEAERYCRLSIDIREQLSRTGTKDVRRALAASYMDNGNVLRSEAKDWYLKALRIFREIDDETGSIQAKEDLAGCCYELGRAYLESNDIAEGREWTARALELTEEIVGEANTVKSRSNLALCYGNMGHVSYLEKNYEDAMEWYQKQFYVYEQLIADTDISKIRTDLARSYNNLGVLTRITGTLSESRRWHEKALDLLPESGELAETTDILTCRADACYSLGVVSAAEGDTDQSVQWLLEAAEISEKLISRSPTVQKYAVLTETYMLLGNRHLDSRNCPEAEIWFRKALETAEGQTAEDPSSELDWILSLILNNLGTVCRHMNRSGEAKEYHRRAAEILEGLVKDTDDPEHLYALGGSFYSLGVLCENRNDADEGVQWLSRAIDTFEKVLSGSGDDTRAKESLSDCYYSLGIIYDLDSDLVSAKEAFERSLYGREELAEAERNARTLDRISDSYRSLGLICTKLDQHAEAREWFERLLLCSESLVTDYGSSYKVINNIDIAYANIIASASLTDEEKTEYLRKKAGLYKRLFDATGLKDYYDRLNRTLSSLSGHDEKSGRDEEPEDSEAKLRMIISSLTEAASPKFASDVSRKTLVRAISSYAPDADADDIVAISGSGFPGYGKSGVLYTRNALYSSELEDRKGIPYSSVESIQLYPDGLRFTFKDGKTTTAHFGQYHQQVLEILTRLLKK